MTFFQGYDFPNKVLEVLYGVDSFASHEVSIVQFKNYRNMKNKANKSTEVLYITPEQAADIYLKLQSYIAEELNNLERMLLEEINQTLQNWLENTDLDQYNILRDNPVVHI